MVPGSAAAAGGAQDLKQAAKRVRDAKKKPKAAAMEGAGEDGESMQAALDAAQLQQRVTELEAENERLRQQVNVGLGLLLHVHPAEAAGPTDHGL